MFWTTIHKTDETDVVKLEDILVDKKASENLTLSGLKIDMIELKGDI